MKLWSWHCAKFSLLNGKVDWQKSDFYWDNRDAYERLKTKVGTDQIIWCCLDRDDWPFKTGFAEWELDVPENEFLAIIDIGIWEHQWCKLEPGPSEKLRRQFYSECLNESADLRVCLERKLNEYASRSGPLILQSIADTPVVNVLLRHPVSASWVIKDGRENIQP